MKKGKRIGIKVGSALLTNGRGRINKKFILEICRQIAYLIGQGHEIFLVSSGAIACGPNKSIADGLRAGIGQGKLISLYISYFDVFDILVAQGLVTDHALREGNTRVLKKNILDAFRIKAVSVINGNDFVDDEETKALKKFADNDELFKLVCILMKVDYAIIGIDQPGLLTPSKLVVHDVVPSQIDKVLSWACGGNRLGHGGDGMKTKVRVCVGLSKAGIVTRLAPGKEEDFILRAINGERDFGTFFPANK